MVAVFYPSLIPFKDQATKRLSLQSLHSTAISTFSEVIPGSHPLSTFKHASLWPLVFAVPRPKMYKPWFTTAARCRFDRVNRWHHTPSH